MKAMGIMAASLVAMGVLPTAAEARGMSRAQTLPVQLGSTATDLTERAAQAEAQFGELRKAISEHQALHGAEAPGWPCAEARPVSIEQAMRGAAMALGDPENSVRSGISEPAHARQGRTSSPNGENCPDGTCVDQSRHRSTLRADCVDCVDGVDTDARA